MIEDWREVWRGKIMSFTESKFERKEKEYCRNGKFIVKKKIAKWFNESKYQKNKVGSWQWDNRSKNVF